MKTSKIIFFSLLGIIATFIIAGAMDIRINGQKRTPFSDWKKINKNIPSFTVLCLESTKWVSIKQGDSSYIQIACPKDSLVPNFNYLVRKDTLFISNLKISSWGLVTVYAKSDLNRFYLKNSRIDINCLIDSIGRKNLYFDSDNSHIYFRENRKNASVGLMVYKGKNKSYLSANNFAADSLDISLLNSTADFYIDLNKIKGSILEKSRFQAHQAKEINLTRDNSSSIRIN